MAKYYRQNTPYQDITGDEGEEPQEEKRSSGNTRLPFGLCKKYRIPLPDDATPRDAWAALEGKTGLKPDQVYEHLTSGKELPQKIPTEEATLSDSEKRFLQYIQQTGIEKERVESNIAPMKNEEIVYKIAGGDETKGSCMSVALAYIGNIIGFDVTDFRGGKSQAFFSNRRNVKELLSFDGIDGYNVEGYNDFALANEVLSYVEADTEYLFIAGRHAAIIRRGKTSLEYLELQSPTDNGYHPLNRNELKERFACQKSHTVLGHRLKNSCHLVRVSSFKENKAFVDVLGYINTAKENQQKGANGNVK